MKQNIIIKIKFGHELENIEKDKSILSLSEQEMLKHAVSAEINDFCSKSNELKKQLSSLKSSIASLESTISKKPSKNNFLSKETVDLRINGMCRIAKAFFDLQSSFLDEFDLSEISKTKSTKESKFFLTIGKDIFLTKQLTRIYSYPEDFGLSRWREEKEIPVPIIILSPIEKFAKKLMFLMDEQEKEKGEYASLLKNWRGLKEQICKELKIPLQSDEAILKELEKQKLEKGISFEKIFFVTEAIKKGK